MKAKPFDAVRSLTDEKSIRRYLAQLFEALRQQALRNDARALGVKDIAQG